MQVFVAWCRRVTLQVSVGESWVLRLVSRFGGEHVGFRVLAFECSIQKFFEAQNVV
jgi:hypothetical protein